MRERVVWILTLSLPRVAPHFRKWGYASRSLSRPFPRPGIGFEAGDEFAVGVDEGLFGFHFGDDGLLLGDRRKGDLSTTKITNVTKGEMQEKG